jgi:hypothetical protein
MADAVSVTGRLRDKPAKSTPGAVSVTDLDTDTCINGTSTAGAKSTNARNRDTDENTDSTDGAASVTDLE